MPSSALEFLRSFIISVFLRNLVLKFFENWRQNTWSPNASPKKDISKKISWVCYFNVSDFVENVLNFIQFLNLPLIWNCLREPSNLIRAQVALSSIQDCKFILKEAVCYLTLIFTKPSWHVTPCFQCLYADSYLCHHGNVSCKQ